MDFKPKYRVPHYRALPKDFHPKDGGSYSEMWEHWKLNVVSGSLVTGYDVKPCILKDESSWNDFDEEYFHYYIHTEDGCADYNMTMYYKMVEVDPNTICEMAPFICRLAPGSKPKIYAPYTQDIIQYSEDGSIYYGTVCRNELDDGFSVKPFAKKINSVGIVRISFMDGFQLHENRFKDDINFKHLGTFYELVHHNNIWKGSPDDPFKEFFAEEGNG